MELTSNARNLRKNSTPAEIRLWKYLRSRYFLGIKFRRQFPIPPYIVDFICLDKKLIIEVDGSQHNEPEQEKYDNRRTIYLERLGYNLMRFWNNEVLYQFDIVMEAIYIEIFTDNEDDK